MPCRELRFLVVEDQEFQRAALKQLLVTLGAQAVHTAEDGQAGLQVVWDPDRPVDIVVSDIAMPGMDGVEFVRHLGESGASISLILTSAVDPTVLASIANVADAYKVSLLGVISKPVTAAKLARLVELHRSARPGGRSLDAAFSLDEITQAWANDEFEPWFEPKVDLATASIRGFTAVPHWQHATRGLLPASEFMESIRARGLNDDFVWLMLRKSAAQCRKWREQGHDLGVTVNLSFQSLTDVHMAPRVQQIAENEGLDPRFMLLTVTEGALNTEQARALENLARLRVMGFGLGIDEFGSGLMDVEQLSRVAFTELKIKGAFVSLTGSDDTARAGLAVGLELAQQLRLKTVAGGIASKEEWNLVYAWGCALGQGPFISGPLRGDGVLDWLSRWRVERK